MAIAYVQKTASAPVVSATASIAIPVANAPSAGNTVVVICRCGSGTVVSSITDSRSNTWHFITTAASGDTGAIGWAYMTTALHVADTITVNLSARVWWIQSQEPQQMIVGVRA